MQPVTRNAIPATLAELTFLGSLNLSNNNLSGRIPYEPHLDTFGAASFSGNPELCGPPLQRSCVEHALEADNDGSAQTVVLVGIVESWNGIWMCNWVWKCDRTISSEHAIEDEIFSGW
jgi:hypothetical protein